MLVAIGVPFGHGDADQDVARVGGVEADRLHPPDRHAAQLDQRLRLEPGDPMSRGNRVVHVRRAVLAQPHTGRDEREREHDDENAYCQSIPAAFHGEKSFQGVTAPVVMSWPPVRAVP